jgi:hypothetical protein
MNTINQAQVDLCTKLGLCPCLPTYNGPNMGLADTDNPVINLMAVALKHLELLQV